MEELIQETPTIGCLRSALVEYQQRHPEITFAGTRDILAQTQAAVDYAAFAEEGVDIPDELIPADVRSCAALLVHTVADGRICATTFSSLMEKITKRFEGDDSFLAHGLHESLFYFESLLRSSCGLSHEEFKSQARGVLDTILAHHPRFAQEPSYRGYQINSIMDLFAKRESLSTSTRTI